MDQSCTNVLTALALLQPEQRQWWPAAEPAPEVGHVLGGIATGTGASSSRSAWYRNTSCFLCTAIWPTGIRRMCSENERLCCRSIGEWRLPDRPNLQPPRMSAPACGSSFTPQEATVVRVYLHLMTACHVHREVPIHQVCMIWTHMAFVLADRTWKWCTPVLALCRHSMSTRPTAASAGRSQVAC